ncbi:MAG TPA: hypothetical protein VJQ54_08495 [Candidatus Sulfotelmatobacter sp.]|nr:hypothetical protein [Candidatus Sulfotelmatobacter sp.]
MMGKRPILPLWITLCFLALPAWSEKPLPAGNGKKLVESDCASCHSLNRITSTGHTPKDWENIVYMMYNAGAPVREDQIKEVAGYLARNFPPKPGPRAVLVPGSATVSIKEWSVPTPGSRPHDPLATADGFIWYTGQMANVLGRFDPRNGVIKEFPLKIAQSGPHGLTADKDGNIWFTANFKAYIGKLNPTTAEITQYPMPDPAARDPHTLVFDQQGTLWFTVQGADMVGRLIPSTGKITLMKVPTGRALPYGMVVSSKGIPFFVEFGSNKIGSIDPASLQVREYVLPHADSRPRRIAITSDDALWYSDYARGYLGRFVPATGKVSEWPSPGGPKSQPYGIAAVRDVIWYSESGVEPNTIVRFDPKTEKFQTWAIPSGGGVVRNMSVTRDGNIALACSGVNKVGLVKLH